MEILIIIVLGLLIAGGAAIALFVRLVATKGGAGKNGRATVLAQLDGDADRVIVDWPTLWHEPTVADVIRHADARGYRLESQASDNVRHIFTFTRR